MFYTMKWEKKFEKYEKKYNCIHQTGGCYGNVTIIGKRENTDWRMSCGCRAFFNPNFRWNLYREEEYEHHWRQKQAEQERLNARHPLKDEKNIKAGILHRDFTINVPFTATTRFKFPAKKVA